jgi:hypothetical protein
MAGRLSTWPLWLCLDPIEGLYASSEEYYVVHLVRGIKSSYFLLDRTQITSSMGTVLHDACITAMVCRSCSVQAERKLNPRKSLGK